MWTCRRVASASRTTSPAAPPPAAAASHIAGAAGASANPNACAAGGSGAHSGLGPPSAPVYPLHGADAAEGDEYEFATQRTAPIDEFATQRAPPIIERYLVPTSA